MKDFVQNMDDPTVESGEFHQVPYTTGHCQLVAMVLKLQEIVRRTRAEAQVGSERFDSDQASR